MATADADADADDPDPDTETGTAGDTASHGAGGREDGDLRAKARYLFRLSRPRFWLYLAGPVIVGVTYAASTPAELFTPTTLALFAYFLLPANVYLYGVNDIFDQDVDEDNPKKEEREVRFRGQAFVVAAVVVTGLGIAALVPLVPAAAYPWLVAGTAPPLVAVVGGWLWTMAMHTFSAIPDIEPDREAGIRTTATVLGQGRTYAYCGLLWVFAAAAFWLIDFRLGVAMLLYPAFLSGIALSEVDVDRAYWWYPALNTVVGALLTMGKLWTITNV